MCCSGGVEQVGVEKRSGGGGGFGQMPFSKSAGETYFYVKISTVHPSSGIWACLQPQNCLLQEQGLPWSHAAACLCVTGLHCEISLLSCSSSCLSPVKGREGHTISRGPWSHPGPHRELEPLKTKARQDLQKARVLLWIARKSSLR